MNFTQSHTTNFLEQFKHSPIFEHKIEQDLKRQQLFESLDFNQIPNPTKPRVSQKLLENRIRRIQINMQKKQQVQNMLQKRRMKEKEIATNIRNRLEVANKRKEECIRQSYSQQQNRKKNEQIEIVERQRKLQANLQRIQRGRQKAEGKRNDYMFRIQRKTEQSLRRANYKKRCIQSIEQAQNDQIHLQEWNSYKKRLITKYSGKLSASPDHLYQDFKQKNNLLKQLSAEFIRKQKHNTEHQQQDLSKFIISRDSTKPIKQQKKVSYFGIHEESMLKKTIKDIQKLRIFLTNEGNFETFGNRPDVMQNFQEYLLTEILNI